MYMGVCMLAAAVVSVYAQIPNHLAHGETSSGPIVGNLLPRTFEYLGMPYASHAQRFAPATDWVAKPYPSSPLDTTAFGPACLQYLDENTTYVAIAVGSTIRTFLGGWQAQPVVLVLTLPTSMCCGATPHTAHHHIGTGWRTAL
jgi:hypothetical protein